MPEELWAWARERESLLRAIQEAEVRVTTGRIEIHYHEGKATVVRGVLAERKLSRAVLQEAER